MTNEAELIRAARAASAARIKAAKPDKANAGTLPAARVPRALERARAAAYAAFVVATARAATAARREKG